MKIAWTMLAVLSFWAASAHASQEGEALISLLKEQGQQAYRDKYLPGDGPKAFAMSRSGAYAWVTKTESVAKAARVALARCQRNTQDLCFLHSVNADVVAGTQARQRAAGVDLLASLAKPDKSVFADEDKNTGVAAPDGYHTGALHSPTPLSTPFAKVINTGDLVAMLASSQKPVVIDVLQPPQNSYSKRVIPSSLWINGLSVHDEKANQQIDAQSLKVLEAFKVDKTSPIVAYCLNWECWLSYNALYRLSLLGYTNLYWYRGGINAWQKAGLPVLEVPLDAQVY